jgi:hypothetical protein
MPKDVSFVKGQPVSAGLLQWMANRMRQLSNWRGDDYVQTTASDKGTTLSFNQGGGFFAKITAGSGPYTWTEVQRSGTSWVTSPSGRTGTLNAYEVNGTAVPLNRVVKLQQGAQGEYIFRYMREFRPCTGYVCVTVVDACDSSVYINGATFTLKDHATGTTIGTCVTSGRHGGCCIPITTNGSYDVLISASGYNSLTQTFSCYCGTNSLTIALQKTSVDITVYGCPNGYTPIKVGAGYTVSLYKQGGGLIGTSSTNSLGVATITGVPNMVLADMDPYVVITNSRIDSSPLTFVMTGGTTSTAVCDGYVVFQPATGYVCYDCCVDPIPTTLYATIGGVSVTLYLNYSDMGYWGLFNGTLTGYDYSCPLSIGTPPSLTTITVPMIAKYYPCSNGLGVGDGMAIYAWIGNQYPFKFAISHKTDPGYCTSPDTCRVSISPIGTTIGPGQYTLDRPPPTPAEVDSFLFCAVYYPDAQYLGVDVWKAAVGTFTPATSPCIPHSSSGTIAAIPGYHGLMTHFPSWSWTVSE